MRSSLLRPLGLAALVFLLGAALPARAALIFLKDGFVLVGKVRQERKIVRDPYSKETYTVPKGFFFVDDGPRRFFFSPRQVQDTDRTFLRAEDQVSNLKRVLLPPGTGRMPIIVRMLDTPDFDPQKQWKRHVKYNTTTYTVRVQQRLQVLNSSYAVVQSTEHFYWTSLYLTQELGVAQVRKLLGAHKAFADSPGLPAAVRVARRLRMHYFFVHAGWYDEASAILDRLLKDFPGEKKKVEEARVKLRRLQAQRRMEMIRRAHKAGRHKFVSEQLTAFQEKDAALKVINEVRALKTTYKTSEEKLKEARRLLTSLLKGVQGAEPRTLFRTAIPVLLEELHQDGLGRLETFLDHALRQERLKTKNGPTPADLLCLALTGWLQGNASAQTRFEVARQLWEARAFALNYLKNDDENERESLRKKYVSQKNVLGVDEVAEMLNLLPPPRAETKLPAGITERKTANGRYTLQLPREYHHGRAYPLLLVLHDGNEKARKMIDRWADQAGKAGYILAAPHWPQRGSNGAYTYSEAEHLTVLETLRDLRLRYHVDCDRVFLFGLGQGGNMAYDVGLSHPDLFAGVMPMAASPELFVRRYWANAQYLPFYVVGGDHVGPPNKSTRELFERWVPHGYPVIYVQYKGRGMEWFGGEVAPMFDWMSRKKRKTPVTQLGKFGAGAFGDEFSTMRATDNHFYWLSSNSIRANHFNSFSNWNPRVLPATLNAYIDPTNNRIFINQRGFRQVTVWLARDAKVAFNKPLTVRINGVVRLFNRKVKPDLATLLEDYYRRGDRQHLFVARIDLKP